MNNKPIYQLPFNAPALDHFLELANTGHKQALAADEHIKESYACWDQIITGILPLLNEDKQHCASGIIKNGCCLEKAFDAALAAYESECSSLGEALSMIKDMHSRQEKRIEELNDELRHISQEAEKLRLQIIPEEQQPLDKAKAKGLLALLKQLYDKKQQLQNLQKLLPENLANADYLSSALETSRYRIKELEIQKETFMGQLQGTACYLGAEIPGEESAEAATGEEEKASGEKHPVLATVWSYTKIVIIAILLAFVIRTYVFDITKVEGLSMYDTLNDGDILFTSKISYLFSQPERGDIIVFDAPDSVGEDYVKRVIGLPNEEIKIDRGLIYINGQLLNEEYVDGLYTDGDIHMIIPEGFYFVMGDNREVSRDSRSAEVGVISRDHIHGKSVLRLYPFKTFGTLE